MNRPYQRKFVSGPVQEEKPTKRPAGRKHRRPLMLFRWFLMLVGAVTLFVLLMRYAIIPLLVMLPQWMGGIS